LPFRTPFAAQPAAELKIITRMREQYAAVQDLQAQGRSNAAIGRKLGLHRATVRKFATAASLQDLIAKTEQRAHVVDAYTGHLHRRWHEGERNATQLFREIQQLGHPAASWRSSATCAGSATAAATPRTAWPPSLAEP
jgi:hypothetical protein